MIQTFNIFFIVSIIIINDHNIEIDVSQFQNIRSSISLSNFYKNSFKIGTAVSINEMSSINNKKVENIIKNHFTSITPENAMKPESILRKNGDFNWKEADKIIDFAKMNNIVVRGHTLLWHKQTPDWFFKNSNNEYLSKDELYLRQYQYMEKVMNRFDYVEVWDVVNEVVSDNFNSSQLYRSKNSNWYKICGEEFVEKAFLMANAISPEKKLFYNDYNLLQKQKQDKVFKMLENLIKKGVPIHGLGIQAHWTVYDSPKEIENLIKRFSSLGLDIHITELDLSVFKRNRDNFDSNYVFDKNEEKKQAKSYKNIFKVFTKHKDKISSVSFWGVSDKDSWLNNHPIKGRRNYPLLFNDEYKPKMNFFYITTNN